MMARPGDCKEFCDSVRKVSEERLWAVMFARDWHVLGRISAEMFDGTRGMQQGQERIDGLFEKKTCANVLWSVDKSNTTVNALCWVFAFLPGMGCLVLFAQAFGSEEEVASDKKDN